MRLINAEPLIDACGIMTSIDWNHKVAPASWADAEEEFMQRLLDAPAINPEDLRPKGKWIGIGYEGYADGYPVYDYWECSNCGNEEKGEDVPEANPYCRCCGAKMEV